MLTLSLRRRKGAATKLRLTLTYLLLPSQTSWNTQPKALLLWKVHPQMSRKSWKQTQKPRFPRFFSPSTSTFSTPSTSSPPFWTRLIRRQTCCTLWRRKYRYCPALLNLNLNKPQLQSRLQLLKTRPPKRLQKAQREQQPHRQAGNLRLLNRRDRHKRATGATLNQMLPNPEQEL